MRVHALQCGRLIGNQTFLRAESWSSLLRRPQQLEFPVYAYVVEHPEGHILIDAGMTAHVRVPRAQRRFVPAPLIRPEDEIGPRMTAAGLDPSDVRQVIVTHLDWDHVGGIGHFPHADVLVHRPEHDFARTFMGKLRYQPKLWPASFSPTLYDLDAEPYGPFPRSKTVTDRGDVRIVPIPGHSIGQVGVAVELDDRRLFFGADHVLRQDWFLDDYAAGRLLGLGIFFRDLATETSRRIQRLFADAATVFLPAHDADAPARLAAMEPVTVYPPALR